MKKSELRQIIKEEVTRLRLRRLNEAKSPYDVFMKCQGMLQKAGALETNKAATLWSKLGDIIFDIEKRKETNRKNK